MSPTAIPPPGVDKAIMRKVRLRTGSKFRALFMTTLVLLQVAAVTSVPLTKKALEPLNMPEHLKGTYDLIPFAQSFAALLKGFQYAQNAAEKLSQPGTSTGSKPPSSKGPSGFTVSSVKGPTTGEGKPLAAQKTGESKPPAGHAGHGGTTPATGASKPPTGHASHGATTPATGASKPPAGHAGHGATPPATGASKPPAGHASHGATVPASGASKTPAGQSGQGATAPVAKEAEPAQQKKAPLTEQEKLIALVTGQITQEEFNAQHAGAAGKSTPVSGASVQQPTPPQQATSSAEKTKPLTEEQKLFALATGQAVRQTKASTCPKRVQLDVSKAFEYKLTTPVDACLFSTALKNPKLSDVNKVETFFDSSLTGADIPDYVDNKRFDISGSAANLLKCPTSTFPRFSLQDFVQFLLGELNSEHGLKIPPAVTSLIFGKRPASPGTSEPALPTKWKSPFVQESIKKLREELEEIRRVPLLVLNQDIAAKDDDDYDDECFYVKTKPEEKKESSASKGATPATAYVAKLGATSKQAAVYASGKGPEPANKPSSGAPTGYAPTSGNEATPFKPKSPLDGFSEHIGELFEKMVPVIMRSVLKPLAPTKMNMQLTDRRCKARSGDEIQRITIEAPAAKPLASYDAPESIPLSLDGNACATVNLMTYLEVESVLEQHPLGKRALQMMAGVEDKLIERVRSAAKGEDELKGAPQGFVKEINKGLAKSLVTLGMVDGSRCGHLKDKSPFGLMILDLPTKELCGEGNPPFNCHSLDEGRTAMLVRESVEEAPCLFSSSQKLIPHVPAAAYGSTTVVGASIPRPKKPQTHVEKHGRAPPGGLPGLGKILACFPASARVLKSDGALVAMRDLRVGEHVEVAPGIFSPVLLFTHAAAGAYTRMVVLESAHGKLVASPTHYVMSSAALVAVGDIRVGDFIAVKRSEGLVHEPVVRVGEEYAVGLYNPQTKDGHILVHVNGAEPVLASVYTTAVSPPVAHLMLTPLRWLHNLFGITLPGLSWLFPGTHVGHITEGENLVAEVLRNVMTGLVMAK